MSDENLNPPPNTPASAAPSDESAMDEFEVKQPQLPKVVVVKPKITKTKLIFFLSVVALFVIGSVFIVMRALQTTGSIVAQATPTPLPTVVQLTPAPTQAKDLPAEWLNVENNIVSHKEAIIRPNDERAKMSIPSVNFETALQE